MPWRLALTADGHRVITRTYIGYQHTTIWWLWLEDQQKEQMVIWWLPQYWLIILSTFYQLMILAWRSPVKTNRYQINQSIKNSRWSSDHCLSIDILTSYDRLMFYAWISAVTAYGLKIFKRPKYMLNIWPSDDDDEKICKNSRLLLEYWYIFIIQSIYDLGLKISSDIIWW